ncbi:hypothetical protein EYF80_050677 [Liparis tanakae]|uniref:Uncharacterized protein n=1 Tax=Liparis tanakae TaxID=230148 RepID=A0A4Z2FDA3_9TELE|nr:hypothetical protein EYF80_050677 [Liparis tanakae]
MTSICSYEGKHSALVGPEVVLGAKEEDRELSDLVAKVLDVGGDASGVSLQNQLPSGIAMFKQSGWKAAGHDSQHSSCPPATREGPDR